MKSISKPHFNRLSGSSTSKCHYDENCIFSIEGIVKHKQVGSLHEKRNPVYPVYYFQISLFVPEIEVFKNMQISQVMMSYTQPNFDNSTFINSFDKTKFLF